MKLDRAVIGIITSCVLLLPAAQAVPEAARIRSVQASDPAADAEPSLSSLLGSSRARVVVELPRLGLAKMEVEKVGVRSRNGGRQYLFRGSVASTARDSGRSGRTASGWAAISVTEGANGLKAQVNFMVRGLRSAPIFVALKGDARAEQLRMTRAPHFALSGKGCLSDHYKLDSGEGKSERLVAAAASALGKNLTVSTEADHLWVSRFGSSANTQISSIMNAASAIYYRDLGMTVSLNGQSVQTSSSVYPSTMTASETLLERFQNYSEANRQLTSANEYILFTGRDMDQGTIGIAYMSVVCRSPSDTYGVVQHLNDALDPIIAAHEIGHTLSAEHDPNESGVMATALDSNNPPSGFSAYSISQISSYVTANGSCLGSVTGTPTDPTPTPSPTPSSRDGGTGTDSGVTMSLEQDGRISRGRAWLDLYVEDEVAAVGLSRVRVGVACGSSSSARTFRARTNRYGEASIRVSGVRRGDRCYGVAVVDGEAVESNGVRLR